MLSKTPQGWQERSLASLAKFINGRAFKPSEWTQEGLPIIRIAQITNPCSSYNCFSGSDVEERHRIRKGDLLFSWSATLTAVIWEHYEAVLNQHIFKVEPLNDVSKSFLLYRILLSIDELLKGAHGTTMRHIKKRELDVHRILLPPLNEQRRIAEILSSVDASIQATQAVIEQAERVKRGLMEELLTGGLGSEAIERGDVPEGWESITLASDGIDLIDGDRGKQYPKSSDFSSEGYCLFLSAKNVTKQGFRFNEKQFVTKEKHEALRKGALERDDIVVTTRGTVGNVAHFNNAVPYDIVRINSGMVIIRNQSERVLTDYLFSYLASSVVDEQIKLRTHGSAQPALTIKTLKTLRMALPSLSSQQHINSILLSQNASIAANFTQLHSLQRLKSALMSDLLTGKVKTV